MAELSKIWGRVMKNSKKMFIIIEAVLAMMVFVTTLFMFLDKKEKDHKISVIIQNSDDNQWQAFKYGLKMAAEDYGVELFVVNTEAALTVEEEADLIESEIANDADAIIIQPASDAGTEALLKKIMKKIPLMLVEDTGSTERAASKIPAAEADNYAMGLALAEELLNDYNGNLAGKTLGVLSERDDSSVVRNRKEGFEEGIKDAGVRIRWSLSETSAGSKGSILETKAKVDLVVALDDNSLIKAGEFSAANNLHGAIVYGIGNSTEAIYYLDTGFAECLIVPDGFQMGYQSLAEVTKSIEDHSHKLQDKTVSYSVIRRETLFSKENQDLVFTMSQ